MFGKLWYSRRQAHIIANLYHKAVKDGDAAGADVIHKCLSGLHAAAKTKQKEPRTGWLWQRRAAYLEQKLKEIDE